MLEHLEFILEDKENREQKQVERLKAYAQNLEKVMEDRRNR